METKLMLFTAEDILYNINNKEEDRSKWTESVLTLPLLQKYNGEDYELDVTRYEIEEEDGDYKLVIFKYDISILDDDGDTIFGEDEVSDCAGILYKDTVLAFANDYGDQDYHETNGYWNGIIENKPQIEFKEWLTNTVTRAFTAQEDSNEADFQLVLESIANRLGIDVSKLVREEPE